MEPAPSEASVAEEACSMELGKERGKVAYTFPLRDADLYTRHTPGEFEQQDRAVCCHSSCDAKGVAFAETLHVMCLSN